MIPIKSYSDPLKRRLSEQHWRYRKLGFNREKSYRLARRGGFNAIKFLKAIR